MYARRIVHLAGTVEHVAQELPRGTAARVDRLLGGQEGEHGGPDLPSKGVARFTVIGLAHHDRVAEPDR